FDADAAFYAAVLGWQNVPMSEDSEGADAGDMRYVTEAPDDDAAGLFDAASFLPDGVPSHWRVYFAVADTDAAIEQVLALGGAVVEPAVDSPHGRVATVADDLGGTFQIIA
ncbi:MAG: VOC family protein, partial [Micrococcus sp.]|nr:VOC family protein [Micrococcus sp.]